MKLWATIKKDVRILLRDKVGLTFMFAMPIVLVIVVTAIQNNTFDLLNKNSISLLVCNKDTGRFSKEFMQTVDKMGMFKVVEMPVALNDNEVTSQLRNKDAFVAVIIPPDFSVQLNEKAKGITDKALNSFGLEGDSTAAKAGNASSLTMYYKPEIQPSFKLSIQSALTSALQMVQSRQVLKTLYFSINEKTLPDSLEDEMLNNRMAIDEKPLTRSGNKETPNASQHNVPAWTIFAMFFIVISLGGSIVREKSSGSFIRLKTLPTSFLTALLSKQITYLFVTLLQALVIFLIGVWIFPSLGLPKLNMPSDILGLLIITLACGCCAVNYAICIGVLAKTQEQANGFGAVSIVILSVIGGLMVPSFAMPASFKGVMMLSPLHWCLKSYYGLFLEGGKLKDVLINILPLILITLVIQAVTRIALKKKNLI